MPSAAEPGRAIGVLCGQLWACIPNGGWNDCGWSSGKMARIGTWWNGLIDRESCA